ncbi:MAG: D-alanyl-D-alanine carboxypeptidase/D-alanyl-D-alanine endopeptidase [Gemmatimonadaceae bacterium]
MRLRLTLTVLRSTIAATMLMPAVMVPSSILGAQAGKPETSAPVGKAVPKPAVSTAARRPAPRRAPTRPALRPRKPADAIGLSADLTSLLSLATNSGRWGVMVVSLTRGDTLYQSGADELMLPASTMKLYTSAIALERFGPAHQFRTEILRDGDLRPDGTVAGSLYLKGAGDPSMAPRYARWNDGVQPMDALVDLVVAAGVKHVAGDIVGDASAFDDRRVPDGWRSRYLQAGYAARVSALSFNENIAHVVVRPTPRGADVDFEQPVRGMNISSTVTVRPGSRGATIRVWQDTTADRFRVSGWIGSLSNVRVYQVVVEQPEQFAAAAFRGALEARGITVGGEVRVGPTPASALRLTTWASAPLAQLVATMNGESNNHFAELLFRNAARAGGGVGSAGVAMESLRSFLTQRVGVRPDDVFAADGSGLSTLDRVTARSMVQLLAYTNAAPWGPVLRASLPVAGMSETLKTRMRATAAQGRLRAKTGTTNDVASLGGYVTAGNGEELAFSFIYNGRDLWRAREAIDAMGATLAGFSR